MIVLYGVLEDPELGKRGHGEDPAHEREDAAGAEAADRRHCAQGDMDGMCGRVQWAGAVGDAGAPAGGGLAPGAGASTTPGAGRWKIQLQAARHLD